MIIKNISNKLISIAGESILPDESKKVAGTKNGPLAALERLGMIQVTEDAPVETAEAEKVPEPVKEETSGEETVPAEEPEKEEVKEEAVAEETVEETAPKKTATAPKKRTTATKKPADKAN